MQTRSYLDANAGAPLLPEVRDAVIAALGLAANASSVHAEGRCARQLIETARAKVAESVGAGPDNVIFTSGATEATALALSPVILCGQEKVPVGRLYVGATEHPCVLTGGRIAPGLITKIPVQRSGLLDLDALERTLAGHDFETGIPLVAVMLANNETGVIHPVAEVARLTHAHGGYLVCDAVQALGRIPLDVAALGADFLLLSAHKIGGPQGVGALVLADAALRPPALLAGGGQEGRRRGGTENIAAIAGFGVAARLARHHLTGASRIAALRDWLEREIVSTAPEVRIAGRDAERLGNTTLFMTPGMPAETTVIAFDLAGIAVSAGSACSSGKVAASHVLEAMGETGEAARSGVRVSLPASAGPRDVESFSSAWRAIHGRMSRGRAA